MSVLKISIVGPSGSGKGTQKDLLAEKINLPSVSMGELLRSEVKTTSERGAAINERLLQGEHVDNSITNDLIFEWLEQNKEGGYIIEGYPRNPEQYDYFKEREELSHLIVLQISDKEVMERITGRRVCPCGGKYHLKYNPPQHNETCDNCGEKLIMRADSTPEATQARIRLYHDEMEPVIEMYNELGINHYINGEQSIERVHQEILKAIGYDKE